MSVCLKNNRIYIGGISTAPTQNVQAGDVYYNSTEDVLYRRDQNGDWVEIGSGSGITVSSTAPNVRVGKNRGQGWFDTNRGALYVWDEQSWIELLDPDSASKTFITSTEPTEDGQGDYWWNPTNKEFQIWDGGTWRLVSGDPELYDQLTELTDVTNSGTNGQMLQANGDGTFTFVDMNRTLAGLLDITNATSATVQHALTSNGNGTFTFSPRIRELEDLTNVSGSTTADQVLVATSNNVYGFVTHAHALEDLTDIDTTDANQTDYVLAAKFDGDYTFKEQNVLLYYGENPPSNPLVGDLWFDTGDNNSPTEDIVGLFIYDGHNWISTGGPVMSPGGGGTTVTLDSSATGAATINSITAFQEIRTSDYISDGDTFEIPSDVWVWSDSTGTAALIVDTDNATIVNNGKIIGKGGDGGSATNATGSAGGPAIQVTASGVTIDNASGAYIAGGGGGGGAGSGSTAGTPRVGGGGGAGGGKGGLGSQNRGAGGIADGDGGAINAVGEDGQYEGSATANRNAQGGQAGGGGGGWEWGLRIMGTGAGGGRILPGVTGSTEGSDGYGSVGNAAHNGTSVGTHHGGLGGAGGAAGGDSRDGGAGGGGGGWGAVGGRGGNSGDTSSASSWNNGGAGGAAVSGSYTQGTWAGTVYGSS